MSKAAFGGGLTTFQVSVTGTAGRLLAASANAPRASVGVAVKALTANTQIVYIGGTTGAATSSSNGWPLSPGETLSTNLDDASKLWAISASGTQTLAVAYT